MNSCCPVVALVAKWLESHCNINYQISHLFPHQFEMLPVIKTYVHWGLFLSTFKFILECFYYHFRIFLNIRNSSENWKAHVQASKCKAFLKAAAAAKSLQSCQTLCDPIDGSPPGSPVPGILQARTLEWVAISFSNAWKRKVKVKSLSRVRLFATPWTAAHQAPLSMGFSRQEYWSGVPSPSPFLKGLIPKIKFGILFLSKKKLAWLISPFVHQMQYRCNRKARSPVKIRNMCISHLTLRWLCDHGQFLKISDPSPFHL